MCKNWNFALGPENYHFALGPCTGNSEFWKILEYLWDESGLKIRSIIGLWTFLPFNYWIDTNKGRRIKGKIGNRVGSRHVSPQQPLYLTSFLSLSSHFWPALSLLPRSAPLPFSPSFSFSSFFVSFIISAAAADPADPASVPAELSRFS